MGGVVEEGAEAEVGIETRVKQLDDSVKNAESLLEEFKYH